VFKYFRAPLLAAVLLIIVHELMNLHSVPMAEFIACMATGNHKA
jgi:hypothetical protein